MGLDILAAWELAYRFRIWAMARIGVMSSEFGGLGLCSFFIARAQRLSSRENR